MDKATLRKVQLVQLEIAKEIKRVCDENGIIYYLDAGTLLGAVRHQGFIPWDDDLDIGMMREDYDRFCALAPRCLGEAYMLQTWDSDPGFPFPFAKVRKKGTVYLENKGNPNAANGIFVDIFPYDPAPGGTKEKKRLLWLLSRLEKTLLMQCHFQPWNEVGHINLKRRVGYLPHQLLALLVPRSALIRQYMKIVHSIDDSGDEVYCQFGTLDWYFHRRDTFGPGRELLFEDSLFRCPQKPEVYLRSQYGDYMTLPPEGERENQHQILEIKF